jgi:uncharacterized protein (TIGR01244 family)
MTHSRTTALSLVACLALASVAAMAPQIVKEELAGVRNFNRLETTVACAGATENDAIASVKKLGFAAIINLRQATESGVDVAKSEAAAKAAGITYVHLPFNAASPDPAVVDRFLDVISKPEHQPAFIHCASGNRAAAMWFVKRVRVDKWEVERAMKEAEALGLTNAGLKQFVTTYVQTRR